MLHDSLLLLEGDVGGVHTGDGFNLLLWDLHICLESGLSLLSHDLVYIVVGDGLEVVGRDGDAITEIGHSIGGDEDCLQVKDAHVGNQSPPLGEC